MNNVLNCITLHQMYILTKTKALPGILVHGKYTFFVQNLYFVELYRLDPISIF